ncbi:MAG: Mov34/MPN/PAD-1 family protein [Thermoplasmata archaeon]
MKRATAIRRETLDMVLEAARDSHPMEFGALLRAEEGVVSELLLVPGTIGGQSHAIFHLHNLPVDFTVVGTVHSHPSPDPRPSRQDIEFFHRIGYLHIIAAHPYDEASWRTWNRRGEPYPLTIVA